MIMLTQQSCTSTENLSTPQIEIPQPNIVLLQPPPEFKVPDEDIKTGEFIHLMVENNKNANIIRERYIGLQEYVTTILKLNQKESP